MGPLPHRPATGRARPVCERDSRAALSYRDEAAGEDSRGAVSDRRWRCRRSPALPFGMGGAPPHRPVPAGRSRCIGPATHPGEALRPGARDRRAARFLRPCRRQRHPGAGACVRLFRYGQVLTRARTAQGYCLTARHLYFWEIRPN